MRMTALEDGKRRKTSERDDEEDEDGPCLRDAVGREGHAEKQAHDEQRERREAAPIDWGAALELPNFAQPEAGPRSTEDPDWHVHVEEGAPIEERKDDAAEGEARIRTNPDRTLHDHAGHVMIDVR